MLDFRRAVIKKLRSQECVLVEEDTTPNSLCFKTKEGRYFFVPDPTDTTDQKKWEKIWIELHNTVESMGLELLPLDYY